MKRLDKGLEAMALKGSVLSTEDAYCLLKGCIKEKDLQSGRQVHSLMVNSGFDLIFLLIEQLIHLFAICGRLLEANLVFCNVVKPSVNMWHAIISAHATCGESRAALALYHSMQKDDLTSCKPIFLCVLKVCATLKALKEGTSIHNHIIRSGLSHDVVVGSTLIDMYAKCGDLDKSFEVFDNLVNRNVVSWNAMITGYMEQGRDVLALQLFSKMQENDINPNTVTFSSILKACGSLLDIVQGELIHYHILKRRLDSDTYIGSSLINMYGKCGRLGEARRVFDMMPVQNLVAWNAMIAGYAQHGEGFPALELFKNMQQEGLKPDRITFSSVLKACGSIGALGPGQLIHDQITRNKIDFDCVVCNGLIDMYAKCGSLEEAHNMFDRLLKRDVVSFGGMIAGYIQHEDHMPALGLFGRMQEENVKPSKPVFLCILKACGSLGTIEHGIYVHEQIIRSDFASDFMIGIALVEMYAKCGNLEEARAVFHSLPRRDVVSWNSLIAGYIQHGHEIVALKLFEEMQNECVKPDDVTISCILKACGNAKLLSHGKQIHKQITDCDLESDVVIGNTLVDMYSRCGDLEEARKVFDALPNLTVVSWGAMIAGYAEHGYDLPALELFDKMQEEGVTPDKDLFLFVLKACGSSNALEQGKLVHDQIIVRGLDSDIILGNVLIEMYSKCGSMKESQLVFEKMPNQDVVSWGALISGYAQHGNFKVAKQCFEDMQRLGSKPDHSIFTSILAVCSHAGCVKEGYEYFKRLREDHGLTPNIEHFNCLVYLLAGAGHMNEAKEFLQTIPLTPNLTGWMSLFTGCRTHGSVNLGRHCFEKAVQLDSSSAAGYFLMSNIFAEGNGYQVQEPRKCAIACGEGRGGLD